MKATFNQKVLNLRQHKIQLIRDYKQFKFDVDMIQNELNDSEITTPINFPEILIDESIDVRNIYTYMYVLIIPKLYFKITVLLITIIINYIFKTCIYINNKKILSF